MQEMLEMLHYQVLPAGSGEEALAIYMEKHKEIDIVNPGHGHARNRRRADV